MAGEHNMADLNISWWDLLQRIAFTLDWSYAALWTVTADGRKLIWKQGYFHVRSNDDASAELFHSLYSSCTFTPGVGFAGHALAHMTNSILWVSGDDLHKLERPVPTQTRFLEAAGIQTVVCLPLGLPSSSVLELGTVNMVRETEDLAHSIKRVLLHLLADGLPNLIGESSRAVASAAAHQLDSDLLRGQMRVLHDNPHPTPPPVAMANEAAVLESAASKYPSNFALSSFVGATLPKEQQQQQLQLGPNIYSELLLEHQSAEHGDALASDVARGIVHAVPPQQQQLPLELERAELSGSVEPSPQERLTLPWTPESSLSQMELSSFHSWTAMAEAAHSPSLGVPVLHDLRRTSSAPSSRLAAEELIVVEKNNNDEIGQIGPFSTSALDQFMAAADQEHQQQQQQQQQQQGLLGAAAAGTSLRGSSSRSSMSLRSQTGEDTEISSAILDSYADCHISDLENVPHAGAGTVGSSSTTMARDSHGFWRSGTPRGSGSSSKETSPESNVPPPPPRPSFGMISSPPRSSRQQQQQPQQQQQQQQQRIIDIMQQRVGNPAAGGPPAQSQSQQHQQHSSILEQTTAEPDDFKQAVAADSTPRLVQFGNVLQLGNAAGQVTEAPPQEHDEAAFSHMLAERRRRNKQNENFTQLKGLIPSAVKMDKASVLAATITYIQELKERLSDLEQSNQRLKNQLLSVEQEQSSTASPRLSARAKGSPGKGSPGRVSLRANSLSPSDEDMTKVSLDGNGNLIIEIRHPCSQPDIAMHIFACLKEMNFKVVNFNVAVYDNRIQASIIVKMKRKNLAGQSAVCAEVEQALTTCLNNFS